MGFIGIFDVLAYLIEEKGLDSPTSWPEDATACVADDVMSRDCSVLLNRSYRLQWHALCQEAPIQVAIDMMAKFGTRRIAVYDAKGQLASVLTQSHLVRWLATNSTMERMGSITEMQLGAAELGSRFVARESQIGS